MQNLTRAQAKRMAKLFRVGDLVTWGRKVTNHRVVEVSANGVWVNVTGAENAQYFASRRVGERLDLLVRFDGNTRSRSGRGPVTLVSRDEDSKPVNLTRQAAAIAGLRAHYGSRSRVA